MRPDMTASEARQIVTQMNAETPKDARIRLMQTALKIGRLSDEAREVYRAALAADGASD